MTSMYYFAEPSAKFSEPASTGSSRVQSCCATPVNANIKLAAWLFELRQLQLVIDMLISTFQRISGTADVTVWITLHKNGL